MSARDIGIMRMSISKLEECGLQGDSAVDRDI